MNINNFNKSIGCNVTECKYHAKDQPYCTLDCINVVKNSYSNVATSIDCTDCASFERDYNK